MPTPNANLAHLFLDRQVQEGRGERVALRTPTGLYSYAQVQTLSLRYAQGLQDLGLSAQDRVLIALPEGEDWVGVFFATLRCGAVVVMANPRLGPEALALLAAHTQAHVMVGLEDRLAWPTRQALAQAYAKTGTPAPKCVTPSELCAPCPPLFCTSSEPGQDAIWLFSGGTTGTPKAVRQSHGSFSFTTQAYAQQMLGLTEQDITISVPKLHFGYATGSNLLFPFSVGASCVLNPEPCKASALAELVKAHQATVLVHVPTMVAKMLADPNLDPAALASLRLATSAGEALPKAVHEQWTQRFGVELLDGLGTAEMWHIFLSNRPGQAQPGSLGQVVPGFEVRLCNDAGQPVSPGEKGWLWVRGGARANGYWRSPQADAAFEGEWYRSGDLLRQDSAGNYYYCGRRDDLIKVSGQWLAPADVENALLQHPHVATAVVVGAPDRQGLQKPYAFVTLTAKGSQDFDCAALRSFVCDRLEPYKAPRAIYAAPAWPTTHLGKADRAKLRALVGVFLAESQEALGQKSARAPVSPSHPLSLSSQ